MKFSSSKRTYFVTKQNLSHVFITKIIVNIFLFKDKWLFFYYQDFISSYQNQNDSIPPMNSWIPRTCYLKDKKFYSTNDPSLTAIPHQQGDAVTFRHREA
jgi:hypothetical protein